MNEHPSPYLASGIAAAAARSLPSINLPGGSVSPLLLAIIPFTLALVGLVWYGRRQSRTHAAMRDVGHQPLVEHTDTPEP
jgi:hypothetical protein